VRGGGGNFGVVTSFEYRLHEAGPMIVGGAISYGLAEARDVLRRLADFSSNCPDELAIIPSIGAGPDGVTLVTVEACYSGPAEGADKALAPLRKLGKPVEDKLGPMLFVDLQSMDDDAVAWGNGYYTKSGLLGQWTPAFTDALVAAYAKPQPCAVILQQLGGAIARVKNADTAFAHRSALFDVICFTGWTDPAKAEEQTEAARALWKTLQPFTAGYYINHEPTGDVDRNSENFGANYARLLKLKNRYDPTNLFRMNANIRPTA